MTKILAYYLPQFHETPENNKWWGEGFTDWVAVKKAQPLFEGHEQPKEPYEYYNLLNKDVLENQSQLMKTYGVDGMCFYHYYFENGRKILEKPAENLLKWKEIDMPFCFYWANESWVRSWSKYTDGNVWDEAKQLKNDGTDGVLLRQEYGTEEQWMEHINYLLPFFKDERYIKINGRPLLIIYNPLKIACMKEMKECFNKVMKLNNMPSVYFLGKNTSENYMDGYMEHEPQRALVSAGIGQDFCNNKGVRRIQKYDAIWNTILNYKKENCDYYPGGYVGYDDTPRHGKNGIIVEGSTPEKFEKYMVNLLIKALKYESEFVFINAWNEWGEGMYLEPDKKNKDAYLKALKNAKQYVEKNKEELLKYFYEDDDNTVINQLELTLSKTKRNQQILCSWIELLNEGKGIDYFIGKYGYKRMAIYGMGILGKMLLRECENKGVTIDYVIDKNIKVRGIDYDIFDLSMNIPDTELIVIAVSAETEEIKRQLSEKVTCKILTIAELIEMLEKDN